MLHSRRQQRFALVGVAGAMVALVGMLAWSVLDGEDRTPVLTPSSTTSDPTGTTSTTAPADLDWDALPEQGIAIQSLDAPLRLFSLAGDALGTAPALMGAVNGPRLVAWPGQIEAEPVGAAEVPDGCASAESGGGLRVALCGGTDGLSERIELVDSTGGSTVLLDGLPPAGTSGPVLGHWRWATPSPDGRWVLAQWSGECEVPAAFVVEVTSGDVRTVTGEPGEDWASGAASFALGWAPDGRAVVTLPDAACGTGAPEPGVYLLDPSTGQLELVAPLEAGSDQTFLWTKRR